MSALAKIGAWLGSALRDPPPEFVFEIRADEIAMSRTSSPAVIRRVSIPAGVIVPSPVKENILDAPAFAEAVRELLPPASARGKRTAALVLPDNTVRLAVLDFENVPEKEEERLALIRFRLRKTVPFDIDEAALSYHIQTGNKMVVALAPAEIISHYEAPFRAAGFQPGWVTPSSLAVVELLPAVGSVVLAHRSPGALTVLALSDGIVTLARSLELSAEHDEDNADPLAEISADLYPTIVYIEDQTGARPEKIYIAGFGIQTEESATRLAHELNIVVDSIDETDPGLAGFLLSLAPQSAQKSSARRAA